MLICLPLQRIMVIRLLAVKTNLANSRNISRGNQLSGCDKIFRKRDHMVNHLNDEQGAYNLFKYTHCRGKKAFANRNLWPLIDINIIAFYIEFVYPAELDFKVPKRLNTSSCTIVWRLMRKVDYIYIQYKSRLSS